MIEGPFIKKQKILAAISVLVWNLERHDLDAEITFEDGVWSVRVRDRHGRMAPLWIRSHDKFEVFDFVNNTIEDELDA